MTDATTTTPTPRDAADLGARVWREIVRTPAFRELVRIQLNRRRDPAAAAAFVRTAMWEDPALSLATAATAPEILNAWLAALAELGRQLQQLPPALVDEFVANAAAEIDGAAFADVRAAWSPLLSRLVAHAPDAATLVAGVDFGKFREGVSAAADATAARAQAVLAPIVDDPAAFANVAGALPPLVNAALRTFAFAVDRIDLPDEILASSAFNLLLEIDRPALGRLLTAMAARINQLHAGSMILGGTEPRFRAVLQTFLDEVEAHADGAALADAILALTEDFETVVRVLTDRLAQDPAAAARAAATAGAVGEVLVRTGTDALQAAVDLRPEELGRRANDGLKRFNRRLAENPRAFVDWLRRFFDALEPREIELAVGHAVGGFIRALFAGAERGAAVVRPLLGVAWYACRRWLATLRPKWLGGQRTPEEVS